jgi:hypothetical protein
MHAKHSKRIAPPVRLKPDRSWNRPFDDPIPLPPDASLRRAYFIVNWKTDSPKRILGQSEAGHRSCKCGAVYDRSEHIAEAREISSFECAVCGETIENWNSAWVPRYRFIACPAKTPDD